MVTLVNKIDKAEIRNYPRALFKGKIVVVQSQREEATAVDYLGKKHLIGIDTETRPSFHKGKQYKVALLQIADRDICFLFRLNYIGLDKNLIGLLANPNILKVGISLHDDTLALQRRTKFSPGGFVDLQSIVKSFGIEDMSLQKIYANVFKEKISKAQRLSNWEADVLSEAQKRYAATDAWACLKLYEEFKQLKATHEYKTLNTSVVGVTIENS